MVCLLDGVVTMSVEWHFVTARAIRAQGRGRRCAGPDPTVRSRLDAGLDLDDVERGRLDRRLERRRVQLEEAEIRVVGHGVSLMDGLIDGSFRYRPEGTAGYEDVTLVARRR